jgi:hypothetical protein
MADKRIQTLGIISLNKQRVISKYHQQKNGNSQRDDCDCPCFYFFADIDIEHLAVNIMLIVAAQNNALFCSLW